MTAHTKYSIVIPTFRRPDMLSECLASLCQLDYELGGIEVIVVDNGGPDNVSSVSSSFTSKLRIRHLVNPRNMGYGFSVNRGIVESVGQCVMLLNDDARPSRDLLRECDRTLVSDSSIGCIGCRAIEEGYLNEGEGIGQIGPAGELLSNFNLDCGQLIDVDHVYGFCYVFTRRAIDLVGLNDRTLLARPYSSGNRIETDHALMIRKIGLRVVYNPRMSALHLAKPRPDMSEVSLAWWRNSIRNTLYLYLKHYGVFGKRAAALRLTFLRDVGILSFLRRPSIYNLAVLGTGLQARASAYGHYALYLAGTVSDRPEHLRELLEKENWEKVAA